LLEFFGIKNGGQYPQQLGNVIVPQMDMWGILCANYHEKIAISTATGTVAAAGFTQGTFVTTNAQAIVPPGELWYISYHSSLVVIAAGQSINYNTHVQNFQTGGPSIYNMPLQQSTSVGAIVGTWMNVNLEGDAWAGQRWLTPGDNIGFWVSSIAAGPINISSSYHVTKFRF
jgi:hypothetical protein